MATVGCEGNPDTPADLGKENAMMPKETTGISRVVPQNLNLWDVKRHPGGE